MRTARIAGILVVMASATLVSSTGFAQQIRSYGSQAEAQYGTSYQGSQAQTTTQTAQGQQPAPTVTTQQQAQSAQAEGEGGEGEAPLDPSYVTVFRPGGAQAPLPVDLTPDKMYRGVIPGTRDEVDHLVDSRDRGADRSNQNRVTWVGFQPQENSTRVFFQTARTADYDLGQADGAVTLTFTDTKLSARNFGRYIDTSFFDRNVTRIQVEQVDKTTVMATITLQQYSQPDVDRSGNYLYVDFPHTGPMPRQEESDSEE